MTLTIGFDEKNRQGPCYWKLNAPFTARQAYSNRINILVKRAVRDAIIYNKWWDALERAIEAESLRYSKILTIYKHRIEGNLKKIRRGTSKPDTNDALWDLGRMLSEMEELELPKRPEW